MILHYLQSNLHKRSDSIEIHKMLFGTLLNNSNSLSLKHTKGKLLKKKHTRMFFFVFFFCIIICIEVLY